MWLHAWLQLQLPRRDEEGASATEYGLMVVAIAAVIAAIVFSLGGVVHDLFDQTCDNVRTSAAGAPCP